MQPKDFLKNKVRKFAKQTWQGPGKFGMLILLAILLISAFESLGLSNRELNLQRRTVHNIENFSSRIESNQSVSENIVAKQKNVNREMMLANAAIEQYFIENEKTLDQYCDGDSVKKAKVLLYLSEEYEKEKLKQTKELTDETFDNSDEDLELLIDV